MNKFIGSSIAIMVTERILYGLNDGYSPGADKDKLFAALLQRQIPNGKTDIGFVIHPGSGIKVRHERTPVGASNGSYETISIGRSEIKQSGHVSRNFTNLAILVATAVYLHSNNLEVGPNRKAIENEVAEFFNKEAERRNRERFS